MSLNGHQSAKAKSHVRITSRAILDPLDEFDLDPCGNDPRPWDCARVTYTITDNGLIMPWFGRVFCNPPFDAALVGHFVNRMCAHGRGILLVHVRTETAWFAPIFHHASALHFLAKRHKFHNPDGSLCTIDDPDAKHFGRAVNSGAPIVLASFGADDADVLCLCGLDGHFVPLRVQRSVLISALINATWRAIVLEWLRQQPEPVPVAALYREFGTHPKARANPNWRPKLRQTLLRGAGRRVARDRWIAAS